MGFVMIQLFHLFKALFDSSGAEMRCQITVKSLLTHLKIPIWLKRLGSIYKPLLYTVLLKQKLHVMVFLV